MIKALILILYFFSCFASAETSKDFIQKNALEIKENLELPEKALSLIKGHKVITIGEIHGNDKSPLFVSGLARSLATTHRLVLALEIRQENQAGIEDFLKTGNRDILKELPHFKNEPHDGRSSLAMASIWP